jgi:hypothetical protein
MAIKTPLRLKMESLKIKGIPLFVKSHTERINAHNIALSMGIEIATGKRENGNGYEIRRVK